MVSGSPSATPSDIQKACYLTGSKLFFVAWCKSGCRAVFQTRLYSLYRFALFHPAGDARPSVRISNPQKQIVPAALLEGGVMWHQFDAYCGGDQRAHRAVLFCRGAGLVILNLRNHAHGTSSHLAGLVNERRGPCKVGPFKPAALQARVCGLLGSLSQPVALVELKNTHSLRRGSVVSWFSM